MWMTIGGIPISSIIISSSISSCSIAITSLSGGSMVEPRNSDALPTAVLTGSFAPPPLTSLSMP
ncbi:MAG TPA: hypothetical protein VFX16_30890 [Pseudonocardiaceae bacterium]|nr:hypothetical protein [Pseudonocardiaceae bacterium]